MFGLLRLAMTLLICILAIGFYLGWFSFSKAPPDPRSNKVNINVSVDENKVRSDLQNAERNLSQRIQEINTQPKGSGNLLPSGQQPTVPRLNFGPISVQPSGPSGAPANDQSTGQSEDFQFTVPLGVPPPGEGR